MTRTACLERIARSCSTTLRLEPSSRSMLVTSAEPRLVRPVRTAILVVLAVSIAPAAPGCRAARPASLPLRTAGREAG